MLQRKWMLRIRPLVVNSQNFLKHVFTKVSSLLRKSVNYGRKKLYRIGPRSVSWTNKITLNLCHSSGVTQWVRSRWRNHRIRVCKFFDCVSDIFQGRPCSQSSHWDTLILSGSDKQKLVPLARIYYQGTKAVPDFIENIIAISWVDVCWESHFFIIILNVVIMTATMLSLFREPESWLDWVFNFKLDCFIVMHVLNGMHTHTHAWSHSVQRPYF
jgi:hypothetical protein